mgnify:CR=1 FL=1
MRAGDSGGEGRAVPQDVHLDLLVPSAARNLVRDKVDTVDLVRVSGQVDPDLERLEIPQLQAGTSSGQDFFSRGGGTETPCREVNQSTYLESRVFAGGDEHTRIGGP